MNNDRKAFGCFLKEMIKQCHMTQAAFYLEVGITKPYYYDIVSGKVNPPPPEIQYRMLEVLDGISNEQRNTFLNLAAKGRGEIPADIARLISEHPQNLEEIRITLMQLLAEHS